VALGVSQGVPEDVKTTTFINTYITTSCYRFKKINSECPSH